MARDRMRRNPRDLARENEDLLGNLGADIRAGRDISQPTPPVIDLGDESEFTIPRTPLGNDEPLLPDPPNFTARANVEPPDQTPELAYQVRSYPSAPAPGAQPNQPPSSVPTERGAETNAADNRVRPPGEQVIAEAPRPGQAQDEPLITEPNYTSRIEDESLTPDLTVDPKIGLYGDPRNYAQRMTGREKGLLAAAERDDLQAERRRRRLGGVGIGLGLLGTITGMPIGAIGTGLASGVAVQPFDERANRNRTQGEINQRVEQDQAGIAQRQQQEAQQAEAAQSAEDRALRARQAEAELGLTQARTQGVISEQERAAVQAHLDEAARTGNLEAARAGLRARVGAIPDPQTRLAWEAELESMLRAEDPELLMEQQGGVARTDVRRGGQGVGGSGGSRRTTEYDPNTGTMVTRRTGGGGPPRATVPRGDGGAPVPVQAPPVEPAEGSAPVTAESYIRQVLEGAGYDVSTPQGALVLQGYVRDYNSPDTAARNAARTEIRTIARQSADVETNDARYASAAEDATKFTTWAVPMAHFRASLQRAVRENPELARAAFHGDSAAAAALGLGDLESEFRNVLDELARTRSGAAVSASEWENFRAILGAGSWFASPEQAIAALTRFERTAGERVRARMTAAGGPQYYRRWQEDNRPGGRR